MSLRIISKGYFHSIDEFYLQNECNIGVGSFGIVKLGIHIPTNKTYAIKIIDVDSGMSDSEISILERQINLHSSINHPHIIKLWDTLQEANLVYMILDYASNGSLFHYQNLHTKFSQSDAYKFFFQTLDALKYLHSKNIMHRDIKPQNLLLDKDYNIKVCDFGWATDNIHQKRTTFCGTYEYMAPEMAYQKDYDYKIDIWALGVLLYQLIHGCAPFKAKSLEEIRQKLSKGSYEISSSCSKDLKQLIMAILQFEPEQRLTFDQIICHDWVYKTSQLAITNLIGLKVDKKMIRKMSNDEMNKLINNKLAKHKKYQSTEFQSSLKGNLFNGYDHRNINKKNQDIKKTLKKKCKTQGEEIIEKFYQTGDSKIFSQLTKPIEIPKYQLKQNYGLHGIQVSKENNQNLLLRTSKMKKLQNKITQLTSKYIPDKNKLKSRNSKLVG